MKIGIIGLKARQVRDLSERQFAVEVVCFPEDKTINPDSVAAFIRPLDKVLVVQPHVPKRTMEAVPKDKRHTITGSISTVVRHLEKFSTQHRDAQTAKGLDDLADQPSPEVKKVDQSFYAPREKPDRFDQLPPVRVGRETLGQLLAPLKNVLIIHEGSVLPEGRTTEYIRPTEVLDVHPLADEDALVQSKHLQRAKLGEVIRFGYPPTITVELLREQIGKMVEQLHTEAGVDVEVHFYNTFFDMMLMSMEQDAPPPALTHFQPTPADLPKDVFKLEPAEAPKQLASDVPVGRRSQYLLPVSDILINYPNSGGVQNYKILEAALPGEVVRFARPEGVSLATWRMRITSMRRDKWMSKGILLEAHFYNEYVDIKVMDIHESVVPANAMHVTVRAEPVEEPRSMGTTDVVVVPEEGISDLEVAPPTNTDPVAEQAPEQVSEEPVVETPVVRTAREREFWVEVYMELIANGLDVSTAAQQADTAMNLYAERFV